MYMELCATKGFVSEREKLDKGEVDKRFRISIVCYPFQEIVLSGYSLQLCQIACQFAAGECHWHD